MENAQEHQPVKESLRRLQEIIRALPQGLQDHLLRTRDAALELAGLHGIAADKVELAALGHDIARAHTPEALPRQAQALGLAVHPVEERLPVLLHGPVAAELLRHECGVEDAEVLEAVRWHSTAVPGLGPVGLVVFLADKLDRNKVQASPHLQEIAASARRSLEQAVVDYLTRELTELLRRGSLIHPTSLEARNHFLLRQQEQP